MPFVLHTDRATARGNLLYRRYDANLALIAPASPNTPDTPSAMGDSRPAGGGT
jgi:hypothetical protein